MAILSTYGILQKAVADELGNRTDLLAPLSDSGLTLSPVKNAIQSAVSKWEREPFYFNETFDYATPLFTTVLGQEFYDVDDEPVSGDPVITGTPYFLELNLLINATRSPITKRSWQYIDDMASNPTSRGMPTDWAYFSARIRLYPIPDGAYPVRASRTGRLAALALDADANAWTEDAFDLIKSEAKLILAREVLHDDEMVGRMQVAIYGGQARGERGYLDALKAETARRARSRIKPTQF